jgi:hypothetical protein
MLSLVEAIDAVVVQNITGIPLLIPMWITTLATSCRARVFWSASSSGTTDDLCGVTYANGIFAAVTNGGKVLTSSDGLTWNSQIIAQGTPVQFSAGPLGDRHR